MKVVTLGALIACAINCSAQVPPGYYNAAAGLTGVPLKQALHNIIDGHTTLSYNSLWGHFYTTDDHPTGRVWDIYSDIPGGTPAYTYAFGMDECGQYNNEGDCYNREHSFPKSWFNDAYPMYSDLHAIYPTDGEVNGKRSNHPYGEVGSPDWVGTNGSMTGMNTVQGYSQTVFEPIDAYKGDLARTYFYMLTRYKDEAPTWTSPMLWNGDFAQWSEYMLLQWHLNDAVSTKEIDRNNAVYNAQGNRNPYIDNPQWVESIWGPTAGIPDISVPMPFSIIGNELIMMDRSISGERYYIRDVTGRLISSGVINSDRTTIQFGSGMMIISVAGKALKVLR